jgi:hypothetical protein
MFLLSCFSSSCGTICGDLSSPLDLVPHFILFKELSAFGFSDGFVSWFLSYVTNCQSFVCVSEIISSLVLQLFLEYLNYLS